MMTSYLDCFQIASIVLVFSIPIGRALYLLVFRNINPIALGSEKNRALLFFEIVAISGLILWVTEVLLHALHSTYHIFPWALEVRVIDSLPAQLFGVVLISLGLVLFVLAYISFGDSWRVGVDVKTPGKLVTSGVFAISRNPIYFFLDLWFVGIFLIGGRIVLLIFAVAAILALHWQIRQEERFLLKLYGQAYQDYGERTARYFMWL